MSKKVNPEIRIVLFGKTGCGKSATGNTILGRDHFPTADGLKSGTTTCKVGECDYAGYKIVVVDTPGVFDSAVPDQTTITEILKCMAMTSPGPHVFLWVLNAKERFSNRDADVFKIMEQVFGGNVRNYVILVFTHTDLFERDFSKELSDPPGSLKDILEAVERRTVTFSNTSEADFHMGQLMSKVTELAKIRRTHFSNDLTQKTESVVEKRLLEIETAHKIDREEAMVKLREGLEKGEEKVLLKVLMTVGGGLLGGVIGVVVGTITTGPLVGAMIAGAGATAGSTIGAAIGTAVCKGCSVM